MRLRASAPSGDVHHKSMVRLILCQERADSLEEYEFACTRRRVDRDESAIRFVIRLMCKLCGPADLSI